MMRKTVSRILALIFAVLIVCTETDVAEPQKLQGDRINNEISQLLAHDHVEGELIVKFRSEITMSDTALKNISKRAHAGINASVKRTFRFLRGIELIKLPENKSVREALEFYLNSPEIEYAEPNYIVHATLTPNDPDFANLWGLHNTGQTGGTSDADIDAPEAWDISTGASTVVIAVVDSGVAYDHPELINNMWTNAGETDCSDGIDNDGNSYADDCIGWDFVDDDNDPVDLFFHGTHVAGTIAASGNNKQGVTGVMWNARIMAVRFLDASGSGTTADAISAIEYANAMGADVINNSWGGGGFSQALKEVIDASPAVVVCAAGNGGLDGVGDDNDLLPHYPSSYESTNIIAVAATDHRDSLASFSNYGLVSVDAGAPGVSIYSTMPAREEVFFDDMTTLSNWTAQPPWGLSSGVYVSGPSSAADSPTGNYQNNSYVTLTLSGPLDLTGSNNTILEYWLRADIEFFWDIFCIEASSNGTIWDIVNCYTGSSDQSFVFIDEDLSAYDGQSTVYLSFSLITDNIVTDDGVYIDDVSITALSSTYDGTEHAYFSGTSMATPHVSGLAGLLKAFNPGLTTVEIINLILNTVDPVSSLSGKVLTGGRINAFRALSASCLNLPVRNLTTMTPYTTIQAAYNAASDGDTLQVQMRALTESPDFNLDKSLTIIGGYDCDYLNNDGVTTVKGSIDVSDGSIAIENFVLQ
jgi:subtilisin family serine protease